MAAFVTNDTGERKGCRKRKRKGEKKRSDAGDEKELQSVSKEKGVEAKPDSNSIQTRPFVLLSNELLDLRFPIVISL